MREFSQKPDGIWRFDRGVHRSTIRLAASSFKSARTSVVDSRAIGCIRRRRDRRRSHSIVAAPSQRFKDGDGDGVDLDDALRREQQPFPARFIQLQPDAARQPRYDACRLRGSRSRRFSARAGGGSGRPCARRNGAVDIGAP